MYFNSQYQENSLYSPKKLPCLIFCLLLFSLKALHGQVGDSLVTLDTLGKVECSEISSNQDGSEFELVISIGDASQVVATEQEIELGISFSNAPGQVRACIPVLGENWMDRETIELQYAKTNDSISLTIRPDKDHIAKGFGKIGHVWYTAAPEVTCQNLIDMLTTIVTTQNIDGLLKTNHAQPLRPINPFPNPCDHTLTLQSNYNYGEKIIVFNGLGQIWYEMDLSKQEYANINVSDWPVGSYSVMIHNSREELVSIKKVLVWH